MEKYPIGYQFDCLTVDSERFIENRRGMVYCKCICGKRIKVRIEWIAKPVVRSCGCQKNYFTSANHSHRTGTLINENGKKICGICKQEKTSDDFGYHCRTRDKLNPYCLRCRRDRQLKLEYGISIEEYETLLDKQGGCCAICGGTETCIGKRTAKEKVFCVDHDHKTGKVRGLLCNKCNAAIALLGDTSLAILKAYNYLLTSEADSDTIIEVTNNNTQKEQVSASY